MCLPAWFKPVPRSISRPLSWVALAVWVGVMAIIVNRSYRQASANLATDLARYGSTAQWRGVYYRGEKLGFTVSQTVPINNDDSDTGANTAAFELQEDGELQMLLLGATTVAKIRTTARVNRAFELQSFEFSLDPGTGPIKVSGRVEGPSSAGGPDPSRVEGRKLVIAVTTSGGTRREERALAEPPMLALNLARRLADAGLVPGTRHQWSVFDPATLSNAPMRLEIGPREIVRAANTPIPAFRVDMEFVGLRTTSWITDTGEVIREESPMGIISVRETAERARALAVPAQMRQDLLQAAAVVPVMKQHIDDPRDVRRMRLQVDGADLSSLDLQGAGQTVEGNIIEISDPQQLAAGPADRDFKRYLLPEPFIESDAPEIQAEAKVAVGAVAGTRARAEALTRYVNSILQKKPTVGLPSAREVLRTKIGDCNEHTALFVAMARASLIPARIAVGLVFVHGAFYYHAWPEVYIDEGANRGLWLPVDPTFNQFPADSTHVRLARGGLEKQAAIIPLIGRVKMTVLELDLTPGSTPILVGQAASNAASIVLPPQRPAARWCLPCFLGGHR